MMTLKMIATQRSAPFSLIVTDYVKKYQRFSQFLGSRIRLISNIVLILIVLNTGMGSNRTLKSRAMSQ